MVSICGPNTKLKMDASETFPWQVQRPMKHYIYPSASLFSIVGLQGGFTNEQHCDELFMVAVQLKIHHGIYKEKRIFPVPGFLYHSTLS